MLKHLMPKVVAMALFMSLMPQAFALSASELEVSKKAFSSSFLHSCVSEMSKSGSGRISPTVMNNYCSCASVEALKLLKTSDFEEMAHMTTINEAFKEKMRNIGMKSAIPCLGKLKH
ncbi:MAG: hypothetical protein K2X66_06925 [Cyanobacteria bacterium]|nr:hypothetical protein [Cyanobacteriota bacterium]